MSYEEKQLSAKYQIKGDNFMKNKILLVIFILFSLCLAIVVGIMSGSSKF